MDSILVSAIVLCLLCFFTYNQTEGTHFSVHEQLKIEEMLQKSAVNTIITEDGDVYDCVDIYKQPSLDHPLLRNHTVKLKPSFVLDEFNVTDPHLGLENGGCSDGLVPIRRFGKEDIERFQAYRKKYPTSVNPNSPQKPNWHIGLENRSGSDQGNYGPFALALTKLGIPYRGARGVFNVYNPSVTKDQRSEAVVYVSYGMFDEHNVIHAGWSADNYQKTGCVDNLCRGFVQVNTRLPLGYRLKPLSIYEGPQFNIPISLIQDQMSGDWWLIVSFNVVVGYWPKELFRGLVRYANEVGWGGRAYSPDPTTFPLMGSGHRAVEGYGKSCFLNQMQYTRNGQSKFEDPKPNHFWKHVDYPNCYDLDFFVDYQSKCNMYFGGPGGNCGSAL
ncbi:hypothetical protein V2J09_020236 [Rumex salicifolius]